MHFIVYLLLFYASTHIHQLMHAHTIQSGWYDHFSVLLYLFLFFFRFRFIFMCVCVCVAGQFFIIWMPKHEPISLWILNKIWSWLLFTFKTFNHNTMNAFFLIENQWTVHTNNNWLNFVVDAAVCCWKIMNLCILGLLHGSIHW